MLNLCLCRICLKNTIVTALNPLFNNEELLSKIETITSIKLEENANLPSLVCTGCVSNINSAFDFRLLIINNELTLHRSPNTILRLYESEVRVNTNEFEVVKIESLTAEDFALNNLESEQNSTDCLEQDAENKPNAHSFSLSSNQETSDHSKSHESDVPGVCSICGKSVKEHNMKRHLVTHNANPVACKICGSISKNFYALRTHMKYHGEAKVCHTCGKVFNHPSKYSKHLKIHPDPELQTTEMKGHYKCASCDFLTDTAIKLQRHKRTDHHPKVICNICGILVRSDNLSKHVSIHTDLPVLCPKCGRIFKNKESMRTHSISHKTPEYQCEICSKVYRSRSDFIRHFKSHVFPTERKHQCHICVKAFTDSDTLKRHIRSHTGERPYPCEYCKKGFSSSYALKTHKRQHTKETPFACVLCPMSFRQKVSLRTHLKSKHRNEDFKNSESEIK